MNSHPNQYPRQPYNLPTSGQELIDVAGLPAGFTPASPEANTNTHLLASTTEAREGSSHQESQSSTTGEVGEPTKWVDVGRVATMFELDEQAARVFPSETNLSDAEKRRMLLDAKYGPGQWNLQERPSPETPGKSLYTPGAANSDQLYTNLGTQPKQPPLYSIQVKADELK